MNMCGRSQEQIEEGGRIRAGVGTRPDTKRGQSRTQRGSTGRSRWGRERYAKTTRKRVRRVADGEQRNHCNTSPSFVARLRVKARASKLHFTHSAAAAVLQGGLRSLAESVQEEEEEEFMMKEKALR